MNIVFKIYSFFIKIWKLAIKHINSFISLLYSIVFKNISGNNMYLSAIVIFGKEISPWWIAGGVGTGLVVAGVIIYMRNHKDDDPNFKIPKIKNEPIIRKPVIEKKSGIDAPQDVLQAPDGNVKPIIKKPVIAEAETPIVPEVPIIKESTVPIIIDAPVKPIIIAEPEVPIIALRKAVTEQAPSPVEAQVISKLEHLKANKIALEKVKLIEELNLAKISKIIKHKDLKISEVNAVIAETKETILKMGGNPVMDANFLEETREYREYLDRMKEDLLKNKE